MKDFAPHPETGKLVPYIPCPKFQTADEYMDFDKQTCASGLKEYWRPLTPGDLEKAPDFAKSDIKRKGINSVFVSEVVPGMRAKQFDKITFPSKN